jgi:PAS domain S-box-containing protein
MLNILILGYAPSWSYGTLGIGGGDIALPTLLAIAGTCGGLVVLGTNRCTLGTARLAMAGVVAFSVGIVAYDGALTEGRITDYVGLIYLIGVAAVPYHPWQVLGLGGGLAVVIGSIGIPNAVVGNIGNGLPSVYSQLTFLGITTTLLTGVSAVLYLRHWVRVRAQEALAESRQQFRGVFEEAGLGIALADGEGTLIEANPALEAMIGVEEDGLHGRDIRSISHPEDRERERSLQNALARGDRTRFKIEKRYIREDHSTFWGHLTVTSLDLPHGTQYIGLVENIDQEKKRKERLRLFRKGVEQAHEAVVISEGKPLEEPGPPILYVNPAFTVMTGYEAHEVIGRSPRFLRGPQTEPWVLKRLRRRLKQGQSFEGEAVNYRKNGTPFVNHWSSAPVRNEEGDITHWVSVQRDVTEERQMDRRLLAVQDEERRRIDEEIHDEMGGLLATLQLTVDRVRMATGEDGATADPLDHIVHLVDELASVTRSISRRLYPGELDDHGLAGALSSLVRSLHDRHGLTVDVEAPFDTEERFPQLVEVTAYRVVHEALMNVVQHAQTDAARIRMSVRDGQLRLRVEDDGRGFDPSTQKETTYGLAGMRERVERLNGEIDVWAAPGEGTQMAAGLPLTGIRSAS